MSGNGEAIRFDDPQRLFDVFMDALDGRRQGRSQQWDTSLRVLTLAFDRAIDEADRPRADEWRALAKDCWDALVERCFVDKEREDELDLPYLPAEITHAVLRPFLIHGDGRKADAARRDDREGRELGGDDSLYGVVEDVWCDVTHRADFAIMLGDVLASLLDDNGRWDDVEV